MPRADALKGHRRLRAARALALGLLSVLCLLCAAPCWARDGDLRWRSVESAHFVLHYPEGLEALAARALHLCEEAHTQLGPLFGHRPDRRVEVTLSDDGDSANGSATALPYPRIQLFAAPPALDSNLNDFDDWLRLLIFHEYAHILQLDHVTGLPAWLNQIFGKSFAPNQALPSFILEGGATWAESHSSGRGRVRSAFFRGLLRAQAQAGRLFALDHVVHSPLDWPGANVWYLYGGHFFHWLAERRDPQAAGRVHAALSDQLIPFGLNRAFHQATGEPLTALYRAWQAELRLETQAQAQRLERLGLTPTHRIASAPYTHRNPRFDAAGQLWNLETAGRKPTAIYRRSPHPQRPDQPPQSAQSLRLSAPTLAFKTEAVQRYDLCPDGQILYDQVNLYRGAYAYTDLFLAHPQGPRRRLSRGARLREPACSADGRFAVATQIRAGGTRLVEVDLGSAALKVLYDPGDLALVGHPAPSPDGRWVVFSLASQQLGRDLMALDRRTGQLRRLTADHALELHPRFSPDGQWIVYASDRDGCFNLYARPWPEEGPTRRLTRVLTGATDPQVSPDGRHLIFAAISADGSDLVWTPFDPHAAPLATAPPVEAPQANRALAPDALPPSRAYQPLDTLWPIRWAPAYRYSEADALGQQVGVELAAQDAAGLHTLKAGVLGLISEEALGFNLSYQLSALTPQIQLDLAHNTRTRQGGALWGSARHDHQERVTALSASVSLPFSRAGRGLSSSLRYGYTWGEPLLDADPIHDPLDVAPRMPRPLRSASLSMGLRLGDTDAYPYSLTGADEGRVFGATLRLRHPHIGGTLRTSELLFDYTEYVPLVARSVLALRISGAFGRGDSGGRLLYALGPPPLRNVLLDALDEVRFGSSFLRGYPQDTVGGDRYVLATAELRVPLLDIFSGLATLPLFLRQTALSAFTDWAQADNGPLRLEAGRFKRSVGGELLTRATVGWRLALELRLGYAYGFDEEGGQQLYFFAGPWF